MVRTGGSHRTWGPELELKTSEKKTGYCTVYTQDKVQHTAMCLVSRAGQQVHQARLLGRNTNQ
jgi:hypothetical protein